MSYKGNELFNVCCQLCGEFFMGCQRCGRLGQAYVVVHADGCCLSNGRYGAQAGIGVYFGPNHSMNFSGPVNGRATNNTAEIQAATKAVYLAKEAGFDRIQINTDSQFVINCITNWIPYRWKENRWTTQSGREVANKQDLVALDREIQDVDVEWVHVRAHTGVEGNEEADRLARKGAKYYNC